MARYDWRIPPSQDAINELYDFFPAAYDATSYFLGNSVFGARFEYVKRVGTEGIQGGALLFNERGRNTRVIRQIILKYFDPYKDPQAAFTELQILDILRGAEHIGQHIGQGMYTFETSQPGVMGNAIVLEYIGHGTVRSAIQRFQSKDHRVPERLIWGVFLCLTRACIAMRYLPRPTQGTFVQRERMPPPGPTGDRNIGHGDLHLENVLFGNMDKTDREHRLGPMIKVIDFGASELRPVPPEYRNLPLGNSMDNDTDDVQSNMFSAANIVQDLTTRLCPYQSFSGPVTVDTAPDTTAAIKTYANAAVREAAVSDTLKHLIFRCLAEKEADRPSLAEVLRICEHHVYNTSEKDYRNLDDAAGIDESDEVIWGHVQQCILDADYQAEYQRLTEGRRQSDNNPPGSVRVDIGNVGYGRLSI